MWPGYLTTSRLLADGIFLNVDTCTKFINKVTVLDQIYQLLDFKKMTKDQVAKIFDSSNVDLPRKTVITSYNTKSYQVDGLDFSKNPDTYSFVQANGQTVSMTQYILAQYKI
jgi:aubergine